MSVDSLKPETPAEDDMATRVFWEILSPLGYIPQPVKEALRGTGFDNLLSLSAMRESDLEDIATQFKLPMGHRRLIKVLSERINQLGIDDLTAKLLRKLDRQALTVVKVSKPTPPNPTSSDSRDEPQTPPSAAASAAARSSPAAAAALVEIYRTKLQQNILSWLTTHGEIGTKEVELQDININVSIQEGKLQGSVVCPFCRMEIKIYIRAPDADSSGAIANSNYIKHYNRMHRKIPLKSPAGSASWTSPFGQGTPPLPASMMSLEQHQQAALVQRHVVGQQAAVYAAVTAASGGSSTGNAATTSPGIVGQLPNPAAAVYELLFKQESNSWDD